MRYRVVEYASDSGKIMYSPQYRYRFWPLWFRYSEDMLWNISYSTKSRALRHIEDMKHKTKIHVA